MLAIAASCCLLAVVCWLLAIDCWLLAIDRWLLVAEFMLFEDSQNFQSHAYEFALPVFWWKLFRGTHSTVIVATLLAVGAGEARGAELGCRGSTHREKWLTFLGSLKYK